MGMTMLRLGDIPLLYYCRSCVGKLKEMREMEKQMDDYEKTIEELKKENESLKTAILLGMKTHPKAGFHGSV